VHIDGRPDAEHIFNSENRSGYALNFDENIKILHVDRLDGFQDDRRDIDDDQPGERGVEIRLAAAPLDVCDASSSNITAKRRRSAVMLLSAVQPHPPRLAISLGKADDTIVTLAASRLC
jgi:hypothetical protein